MMFQSPLTLESTIRKYEIEANFSISDSNWHDCFTLKLVSFLHQCVIHGIEKLAKKPGRKLNQKFKNFQDIFIKFVENCTEKLRSKSNF